MTRAGRLDTRITLNVPGAGQDAWKQPTGGDGSTTEVWAAVEPVKTTDKGVGAAVLAVATTRVLIRYLAGVDTTYTVTIGGKVYGVVATVPARRRGELVLYLADR